MNLRTLVPALLATLVLVNPAYGQSVVVDEGTFLLTVNGEEAGTESFSIRRSGLGNEGMILAHGVVTLTLDGATQEVRPILQAVPADGSAAEYQVNVTGSAVSQARLALSGNRYVSQFTSQEGTEEREFLARPGTRIIEVMVAHHYYFLRSLRDGMTTSVIEPRSRRAFHLAVSSSTEEEIRMGPNDIQARRVTFGQEEDARTVWFDGQGRVLRVEVPSLGYVAQREDLAG